MVCFPQLDSTHQDGGADETCVSSGQFSADGDGKKKKATGKVFKHNLKGQIMADTDTKQVLLVV